MRQIHFTYYRAIKINVMQFTIWQHVKIYDVNAGLDPSLPLFRMVTDNQKLDSEDASFVDVFHSDGGDTFWHANHLGMGNIMGHVDVYVNQGIFQPGCPAPNLPSYEGL